MSEGGAVIIVWSVFLLKWKVLMAYATSLCDDMECLTFMDRDAWRSDFISSINALKGF